MEKAVIFDLDGTLLDSVPDILDNINLMLAHFGYPTLDVETIKGYVGSGARNLCARSIGVPVTEEELDERLSYYNGLYTNSESPKTKLFDGMAEVLRTLKNRGYKLAILTNKPQETTDKVYKNHLKDFEFDAVVGQSGSVKCKPDKTATVNLLGKLGVLPENCYFVGDGETDVQTSLNAGTRGISVLWGYRKKHDLEKAGAKVFAEDPEELLSLITL